MLSSPLKRPHSPSTPGSAKRHHPAPTIVVLGNSLRSNGLQERVSVSCTPDSITPNDVYKAASEVLGTSNSYDMAELHVESIRNQEVVVATLSGQGKEERSTQRKEMLSDVNQRLQFLLQGNLNTWQMLIRNKKKYLAKFKEDLKDAKYVYKFEVFETLLRALNDIIFNPKPGSEQINHRGIGVLHETEIAKLEQKGKNYISRIFKWNPDKPANAVLKAKALSCLTQEQQMLANALLSPAIHEYDRTARNTLQHLRTSRSFAKTTVQQVFQELDLGAIHLGLTLDHFNDVIDHAPPLGGNNTKPFFLENDQDMNSPQGLEETIAELEEDIQELEVLIREGKEHMQGPTVS